MIRKFTLALILCCILISCGKKGDPEYKESTIKKNMQFSNFSKKIWHTRLLLFALKIRRKHK